MNINKNVKIEFDKEYLIVKINNKKYIFLLDNISSRLSSADDKARNNYIISPSGYGVHWSEIDEDISIPALIKSYKKNRMSRHKTHDRAI